LWLLHSRDGLKGGTMAKRKTKKQSKQTAIAAEVTEQQLRLKLRRQIALLKKLPEDFRDITLGTEWEAFAEATGRQKEMNDWWNGPVLILAPLNQSEKSILGSPNKLLPIITATVRGLQSVTVNVLSATVATANAQFNGSTWHCVLSWAAENNASWIYLPDEELPIITALNILFSRFGLNIRAKGQLISEHTGQPVGVVY